MSDHWYDSKTGEPKYTIIGANGKKRDTTLRDARKFQYVPSVTKMTSIPKSDFLNDWTTEQILLAAYDNKNSKLAYNQWQGKVKHQADTIRRNSQDRGSEIHQGLEYYIKNGHYAEKNYNDIEYLEPVLGMLNCKFNMDDVIAEHSFAHELGFGGSIDLYGYGEEQFILDFKTKNSDDFTKKMVFDSHLMQLAAYRLGMSGYTLDKKEIKCYNLFISTVKPGLLHLHEWKEEEIQRGEEMFLLLLKYWQLSNKFEVIKC